MAIKRRTRIRSVPVLPRMAAGDLDSVYAPFKVSLERITTLYYLDEFMVLVTKGSASLWMVGKQCLAFDTFEHRNDFDVEGKCGTFKKGRKCVITSRHVRRTERKFTIEREVFCL